MTRPDKPADPAAERSADISTKLASGPTAGKSEPDNERSRAREENEDPVRRTREERDDTPRAYDRNADPAMPEDDSTLRTEI